MIQVHIEQFLKLPDWEKVTLRSDPKYRGFPLMTEQQRTTRNQVLLDICFYFSKGVMTEDSNPILYWPNELELYVTPRLLDFINFNFLSRFASCYYCEKFNGFHSQEFRMFKNNARIIPISGKCYHRKKYPAIVSPNDICPAWSLKLFYSLTMYEQIKTKLKDTEYTWEDYQMDLDKINLWMYFSNPV